MKCIRKWFVAIAIQLLILYVPPLLASADEIIGMVLWMLIATGLLSSVLGIATAERTKYLYPFAAALAFVPAVFIFYNDSALVHILWYYCASMIGILIGAATRTLIERASINK